MKLWSRPCKYGMELSKMFHPSKAKLLACNLSSSQLSCQFVMYLETVFLSLSLIHLFVRWRTFISWIASRLAALFSWEFPSAAWGFARDKSRAVRDQGWIGVPSSLKDLQQPRSPPSKSLFHKLWFQGVTELGRNLDAKGLLLHRGDFQVSSPEKRGLRA
jgi:hypothetical protein